MHPYEMKILKFLSQKRSADPAELRKATGLSADSVTWAVRNLEQSGAVKALREKAYVASLTDEGRGYAKMFPEEGLVKDILQKGQERLGNIKNNIALVWAKRNGWITVDKGYARITKAGADAAANPNYRLRVVLNKVAMLGEDEIAGALEKDKDIVSELVKRNLLELKERERIRSVQITEKGLKLGGEKAYEEVGVLTRELIASGGWKGKSFKSYDVSASSEQVYPARPHLMHEFIDTVRSAWLGMGFTEVQGPIIESAFWNFDTLFSPQDHPTRDMQDTFFLSNPKQIDIDDIELMRKVKSMHEDSWREEWSEEVAKQALLRTHTTSVSARYIRRFANALESSYPVKLFSVGKVFRNESIDYKHLAELHQIDGIVIGNGLTFSNLIDTLNRFYSQLGIDDTKVRPAYFPFVEPGLEMYYYDERLKRNVELVGAGIIRREITKAMGTSKTVLAWGAGLERLLLRYNWVNSITDLYRNDMGWLRSRPELEV